MSTMARLTILACFVPLVACGSSSGNGNDASRGAPDATDDQASQGGPDASDRDANADGGGADAVSFETSTGGEGGGGCSQASQCPAVPPGPCASLGTRTCTGGVCGLTYTAGPAPSQRYGSCTKNMCDATGKMAPVTDDTNVFVSGLPCELYLCTNGQLNSTVGSGTACSLGGTVMGVCEVDPDVSDPGFVCASCDPNAANSCSAVPGTVCDRDACRPSHCTDTMKDVNETDTDCGGPDCLPCQTSQACMSHTDCFSGSCMSKVCIAPNCYDGVQNGTESYADCGGLTCPKCTDTQTCAQPTDCTSGVCKPSGAGMPDVCQAPTCTDGVQNGGETGVDCGGSNTDAGPACPPCGP
jgi:hypothetical protein